MMKTFENKDVENYYDQTQVHYRMMWKLDEAMGLHYGIWDKGINNLKDAILNTNARLAALASLRAEHRGLDAGCGIGGSSIYLAKHIGCSMHGITLSRKQSETARATAAREGLSGQLEFSQQDYTATNFPDNHFDFAWCIESMQTASDKTKYFKEMRRVIKPGGHILIADIFKPQPYDITKEPDMQVMLNGWAMSDAISLPELHRFAGEYGFEVTRLEDVSRQVRRSVDRIYYASILGKIGTKLYNTFRKASYFSRIHYTTGFAQRKTFLQGKWGYYLVCLTKK